MKLLPTVGLLFLMLWISTASSSAKRVPVTLDWTASTTPDVTYNVYRSSGTAFTKIASDVVVTTYKDEVLPKHTYSYEVTAYNGQESPPSNIAEVTVP